MGVKPGTSSFVTSVTDKAGDPPYIKAKTE
jgi:hypothetical protein